jgi:hypothetical protein
MRRGHGNVLRRRSGETSGEKKERDVKRTHSQTRRAGAPVKTILHAVPSSLSARLLPGGAGRRDATQNPLRDFRRDLEARYTHRQLRRNTIHPHAWGIHRRFIMPSQAIVIFRGTGHVFGTKSWQPRTKQNVQRSKKQIHLALRFRYTRVGNGGTNCLTVRTES